MITIIPLIAKCLWHSLHSVYFEMSDIGLPWACFDFYLNPLVGIEWIVSPALKSMGIGEFAQYGPISFNILISLNLPGQRLYCLKNHKCGQFCVPLPSKNFCEGRSLVITEVVRCLYIILIHLKCPAPGPLSFK